MVTLNTLLLVCLIVGLVASVATVAFFLLLGVYLNLKEVKKEIKNEESDDNMLAIPMSAIPSMGGRQITQADVDRARAAMVQQHGQCVPGEEKKEPYVPNEGAYI